MSAEAGDFVENLDGAVVAPDGGDEGRDVKPQRVGGAGDDAADGFLARTGAGGCGHRRSESQREECRSRGSADRWRLRLVAELSSGTDVVAVVVDMWPTMSPGRPRGHSIIG